MHYASRLARHLAGYRAKHLSVVDDSPAGADAQPAHVLPKAQFQLNILPGIRGRFRMWFQAARAPITLRDDLHQLTSTRAMVCNLFFPFLDETSGRAHPALLKAIGLPDDLLFTGELDKIVDPDEGTRFDFYLEGPGDLKVFFATKLAEREFAGGADDELNRDKVERYRAHLADNVDAQWLEPATFLKHFEILRNLSYLGRYARAGMVFIFPHENESLFDDDAAIKRMASRVLAPRVEILYLEYLVARLLTLTEGDAALHAHCWQLKEKYLVQRETSADDAGGEAQTPQP
jgi:hypothetical protein